MNDIPAATIVSIIALLISFYGVWEKRRDIRRAEMLRLGALVEELNKLSFEQDRLLEELQTNKRRVPMSFYAINNSRREVLCSEANELVARLRARATSTEVRVVASNWIRAGRQDLGEPLYRQVIARTPTSIETIFALRGLGSSLVEAGSLDEGLDAYKQAIQLIDSIPPHPVWKGFEKGNTYISMAYCEASMGHREQAQEMLAEAKRSIPEISHLPRRRQLSDRIENARKEISNSNADDLDGTPASPGVTLAEGTTGIEPA